MKTLFPYFGTSNNIVTINSSTSYSSLIGGAVTTCNGSAGSKNLSVASASGFSVGKRVLIYKGKGVTTTPTGVWELNVIESISGSTLTLVFPLVNSYQTSGHDYSVVLLCYECGYLTIASSGTIVSDWTAIPCIFVRGRLEVYGSINTFAGSYSAGSGIHGGAAWQGQSQIANGIQSRSANGMSGGGGHGGHGHGFGGNQYATHVDSLVPGGSGGGGNSNAGTGGSGGKGGGCLVIYAKEIFVASGGSIHCNAEGGSTGVGTQGGGGGGGGGTLHIYTTRLINRGTISATGAAGGWGANGGDGGGGGGSATANGSNGTGPGGTGGSGADGRVVINASLLNSSGTISPAHIQTVSPSIWTASVGMSG